MQQTKDLDLNEQQSGTQKRINPLPNESMPIELKRAAFDMLRNANTGMMSWAEKNFKHKLIDNLYHMGYYKYNQTIYLTSPTKEKR